MHFITQYGAVVQSRHASAQSLFRARGDVIQSSFHSAGLQTVTCLARMHRTSLGAPVGGGRVRGWRGDRVAGALGVKHSAAGAVRKQTRRRSGAGRLSLPLGSPARSAKARSQHRRHGVACAAGAAQPLTRPAGGDTKSQLRRIVRLVHPDLYTQEAQAHEINSASLQRLNAYVDALESGQRSRCAALPLRFLVRSSDGAGLREVACTLPAGGSLAPLFSAFAGAGSSAARVSGVSEAGGRQGELVEWLQRNLSESHVRRQQHEGRAARLSAAKAALQREFGLQHLHLGFLAESATADGPHLATVGEALRCLSHEASAALRNVHLLVADPQEMPAAAAPGSSGVMMPDGTLWLALAPDWRPIWRFLRAADLTAAATAGQAAAQAAADVQARLPEVAAALGVKYVFAPSALRPQPLGGFCSAILAAGPLGLPGRAFRFGIHVSDHIPPGPWDIVWPPATPVAAQRQGPLLAAYARGQRSVMVAVTCSPHSLAEFLEAHGEACDLHRAAGEGLRAQMESAQKEVLQALGAALHASVQLPDDAALAAARRLLSAAGTIRDAVGAATLSSTRILLVADADPCAYEVLPNGTLCIPSTFQVDLLVKAILGTVKSTAR